MGQALRPKALLFAALTLVSAGLAGVAAPDSAAAGPPAAPMCQLSSPQIFNYTGQSEQCTVPAGVSSLTVTAFGGAGGTRADGHGGAGGVAGQVEALVPVAQDDVITVWVAQQGSFEGGGFGFASGGQRGESGFDGFSGTGGGGASAIAVNTAVLVVAGGGGGGGGNGNISVPIAGGNGGNGGNPAGDGTAGESCPGDPCPGAGGEAGLGGQAPNHDGEDGQDGFEPFDSAGGGGGGGSPNGGSRGGSAAFLGSGGGGGGGGDSSVQAPALARNYGTGQGGDGSVTLQVSNATSYTCTNAPQNLTVPAGVDKMQVTAVGGAGASGENGVDEADTQGGSGAELTAVVDVAGVEHGTNSRTYQIFVGCHGGGHEGGNGNGHGGIGGDSPDGSFDGGGGGGGTSLFGVVGGQPVNLFVHAGGGGGAGGGSACGDGGRGGDGGVAGLNGPNAGNGSSGGCSGGGGGGQGAGECCGDFENGGNGGDAASGGGGGGGGGGFRGGTGGGEGAGFGPGGGGGGAALSAVSPPWVHDATLIDSGNGGDGYMLITYLVPTQVVVAGGSSQQAPIGTSFTQPLRAQVLDQAGGPVSNVPVAFTIPSSGPAGTFAGGGLTATAPTAANGIATSPTITANLEVGPWEVEAAVGGDVSPVQFSLTNTALSTATSVTSSANPAAAGEQVTFTATVTGQSGGPVPTGTVQFTSDGQALGDPVTLANGVAQSEASALPVGSHTIEAAYQPNEGLLPSTGTLTQVVEKESSATTVASSANPSGFGDPVTFTATVAPGAGTQEPTGTVQFSVDGQPLGSGVALSNGTATSPSIDTLTVGTHAVEAAYSGDDHVAASTGKLTQAVGPDATATAVSSSPNPSVYGQPVTYTATVTDSGPDTPTGTVTFTIDGTQVCDEELSDGAATCEPEGLLDAGSHDVDVAYPGGTDFSPSSGTATHQVVKATTGTEITSDADPSVFGQPVTFTANITVQAPGGGTPSGSVQFLVGNQPLGDPVPVSGGAAVLAPITSLPVGVNAVSAQYLGDANHSVSSQTLFQDVARAQTTTTLTSSPNPSTYGEAVTFTAQVGPAPPAGGDPTGSVRFFIDDTAACDAPITGGAATCLASTLLPGDHAVLAEYSGDVDYHSSSGELTQQVTKVASTTTLESSLNPSHLGEEVTLTADVLASLPSGSPGGTVTFTDGSTTLATVPVHPTLPNAAAANFATTELAVGTHDIVATYSGHDAIDGSASAPLQQTVQPPPEFFQPDAMRESVRLGRGIYDDGSFAYQTSFENVKPRFGATLDIYIQNNGNATDDFLLTGVGSSTGFLVRYQQLVAPDGSKPKNYITEQVVGGGFLMNGIPAGGEVKVRIQVKVAVNAVIGSQANLLLRATSGSAPPTFDANRLFVTVVR